MEQYPITLGDKFVGKAEIFREGLYYRIRCRCDLTGETVCRVKIRCGDREESLGVLAPVDGVFGLDTRIPVKRIGEGKMTVTIHPKHRQLQGEFVCLCPEEPFRYITRINDSYLEKRKGRIGIVIKEPGCV